MLSDDGALWLAELGSLLSKLLWVAHSGFDLHVGRHDSTEHVQNRERTGGQSGIAIKNKRLIADLIFDINNLLLYWITSSVLFFPHLVHFLSIIFPFCFIQPIYLPKRIRLSLWVIHSMPSFIFHIIFGKLVAYLFVIWQFWSSVCKSRQEYHELQWWKVT